MTEPYPGYAECCKRWDKVRTLIDFDASLARIEKNIQASTKAHALKELDALQKNMGTQALIELIRERYIVEPKQLWREARK